MVFVSLDTVKFTLPGSIPAIPLKNNLKKLITGVFLQDLQLKMSFLSSLYAFEEKGNQALLGHQKWFAQHSFTYIGLLNH